MRAKPDMPLTRLTWLAATVGAAVFALGCGEGRVIFNVDVLSYKPTLADTVPYAVPAGQSITGVRDSFGLALPGGLGNSTVDSVTLIFGSTVLNAGGNGTFKLDLFFSNDSSAIFSSSVTYSASVVVTGADTQALGPVAVPLTGGDTLFTKDRLWVGVRGSVSADAGAALSGRFVTVSVLRLRIVLQDHLIQ